MNDRNLVILIHRDGARSIPPNVQQALLSRLKQTVNGTRYEVKVYKFSQSEYPTFGAILDLFNRAAVVVGVHGAGLANLIWAPRCTTIVEIMYDGEFLPTPTAFYAASIARRHDYWMQLSPGAYTGIVSPDPDALAAIVAQVIVEKEAAIQAARGSRHHNPLLTYCDAIKTRNRTYIDDIRAKYRHS